MCDVAGIYVQGHASYLRCKYTTACGYNVGCSEFI